MKGLSTFLLYIVLPIAFLGFLFWLGWGGGLNQNHNLIVKDKFGGDIGVISSKSQPLERNFTIVNQGKEDVTIAKIYTDCKCLSAVVPVGEEIFGPFGIPIEENLKPLGINIGAGAEIMVKLTFNPADAPRQIFSGNIFIETLKAGEILKIPINANIVRQ